MEGITLKVGDKAPDFVLPDSDGNEVRLSSFLGKNVVLYFYPKNNTPGCTQEAKDFTDLIDKFNEKNTVVIGISADSPKSHKNFINKHGLKVILLSDQEKNVLTQYGVWQKKKVCGKECEGIVRTTFLIDENGVIKEIWENVKVKGHAEEVLNKLA